MATRELYIPVRFQNFQKKVYLDFDNIGRSESDATAKARADDMEVLGMGLNTDDVIRIQKVTFDWDDTPPVINNGCIK